MKIQKLFALILITAFVSSCNDARFDKIPGIYQELIPQEIQGNYQFKGKDFKSQKLDSLSVQIGMNQIKFIDKKGTEVWTIHQDFQMHQTRNLIVMGKNDNDIKSLYNLTVIEPVNNGIRVYFIFDEKIKNSQETILQRYFPFMDVNYNHDPIPNAAVTIDGSAPTPGNGSGNQYRYYLINEDQFINFFEKELKNQDFVLLQKETKEKSSKKDRKK